MPDLLTAEQLAAIRARADAAPSGPWQDGGPDKFYLEGEWTHCVLDGAGDLLAQVDCEHPERESHRGGHPGCERARATVAFIAAARSDVPALLARLARLAALGDRLLRCAERELVPGAELAREWAEAREGV
jgi:hypothetical protein